MRMLTHKLSITVANESHDHWVKIINTTPTKPASSQYSCSRCGHGSLMLWGICLLCAVTLSSLIRFSLYCIFYNYNPGEWHHHRSTLQIPLQKHIQCLVASAPCSSEYNRISKWHSFLQTGQLIKIPFWTSSSLVEMTVMPATASVDPVNSGRRTERNLTGKRNPGPDPPWGSSGRQTAGCRGARWWWRRRLQVEVGGTRCSPLPGSNGAATAHPVNRQETEMKWD